MAKKSYIFYNDPAHGWLKVSKAELVRLGIADKISSYSYQKGENAYLEEDCDATTFINAKLAVDGIEQKDLVLKDCYSNKSSKIRSYQDYTA